MATRKPKQTEDNFIKALNPRDVDQKYMGDEPFFPLQPDPESRISALARAFTWYHRFYNKKDGRELLAQYCEFNKRTEESKQLRKVHESEFLLTLCWLARMTMRGLELTEHENATLQNEISRLVKCLSGTAEAKTSMTSIAKEEVVTTNRPNIQEILREKASEAAGELEGVFDEFITEGKTKTKTMEVVSKFNVMPQHIGLITEVWKKKQIEFANLQLGSDKQLVDGYSYLSKIQIRNVVKFIDQVLTDLNAYISVKKASKAPRARKLVPVEKQVAKLKYLKAFKDAATKLDLVSIHPTKLHGASEAWVYDTAKRKLHHYIADEYSKTFTVKGSTLLGFDSAKSEVKTLRKPAEQLKEVTGSKPAARKYFTEIKAVSTTPNGRFNEAMLILKAW